MAKILTCQQAAELIGLSKRSLDRMRVTGAGPKFFRAGPRAVRYREDAVLEWAQAREAASRAEEAARKQVPA